MEVIQWTALWNKYKDEFEKEKSLVGGSLGDKAGEDLKLRIIEHVSLSLRINCSWLRQSLSLIFRSSLCNLQNILVVSKYYSRITLKRLAELLCLSIEVIDLALSGCIMRFSLLKLVIQFVFGWGIISGGGEASLRDGSVESTDCKNRQTIRNRVLPGRKGQQRDS